MQLSASYDKSPQTAGAQRDQLLMSSIQDEKEKKRPQTSTDLPRVHAEKPFGGRKGSCRPLSSYSRTGQSQYTAALSGARKLRIDKFQARFTFAPCDPKYYSNLPAQPATGWWKALIAIRRQSPSLVDRLCRNLDILLPDTIYTTSTKSYYITNSPLALASSSARAQQLSLPESPAFGWLIKEDFEASRLFERNLGIYLAAAESADGPKRRASVSLSRLKQQQHHSLPLVVPAAVMKQAHYAAANKNVAKALDLPSTSAMLADSSGERLVQAFVQGKKASRCQLTRVAWRAGNSPIGFTLINKLTPEEAREANLDLTAQFCVSGDNQPPSLRPSDDANEAEEEEEDGRAAADTPATTFEVVCLSGACLAEAAGIAQKLLLLTQTLAKLWLESLVVDLVKSRNGKSWYFLQVKAFTLKESGPWVGRVLLDLEKEEEEMQEEEELRASAALKKQQLALMQRSICAMCGLKRNKKALNRMMNHRMMLEAQHHMRKRGVDILFFHQARRQQLSAVSAVCGTCYSLYLAEKELIQLEAELARETGQPISSEAGRLCFVTGILDAIQGSFLMNDPDLLELLQAFSNACPWGSATAAAAALQQSDERLEDFGAPQDEQDILLAMDASKMETEEGLLLQRAPSEIPQTRDAQGGLITFHGGEAVRSRRSPLPAEVALPAALHQWRLMLFLESLQDPPAFNSNSGNKQQTYLLQLNLFGQTSPVLLPRQDEHGIVRIRRMLIFYLFSKQPTVKDIFKGVLHFSLREADSHRSPSTKNAQPQSAGVVRQPSSKGKEVRINTDGDEGALRAAAVLAVGSCSLGRLAGKRNVKNQTYVLLFGSNNGRCRLRISLGLHRDIQVPSQYVSVRPFQDAFLPISPYCCSYPLPPEWLDLFAAPSDA
ncbi:hypothetical protein Efla_004457 [Eimeria flavescens]